MEESGNKRPDPADQWNDSDDAADQDKPDQVFNETAKAPGSRVDDEVEHFISGTVRYI